MKTKLVVAAGIMVMLCAGAGWAEAEAEQPRITVNGEAVVYAQPDKVTVNFGVETWDNSIAIAKKKNNEVMSRAVAAAKKLGVENKEIQTDYLTIEPRYKNDYQKKNFLGYFVSNTMAVTIADPGKLEKLVEKLLEAGIENIGGIDFQVSEYKKYREQAREMALKAAQEKAEKMAAVLNRGIGAAMQISEGYSGWSGWGSRRQAMTQNVAQEVPGGGGEPGTIALGKISIRASVSVTFELK
ncbi:MAG TPA: SIMPL domain-containing protein [Candidatus Aminicenantes bacterium]|nr:SIMPL domain-containing protein [Candidatus Aminicenantes bacterium]